MRSPFLKVVLSIPIACELSRKCDRGVKFPQSAIATVSYANA
ncbi:hypothetical protein [Nostoc sp.]